MPNDPTRVAITTGHERRRRYSAEQKLRLIEKTVAPDMTISAVARLRGISPSLLFGWRRLMAEGGKAAIQVNDDVVAARRVRALEGCIRDLELLVGRKTMEVEVLRGWAAESINWAVAREKSLSCSCRRHHATVPGEGRGQHPGRSPFQPDPANPGRLSATGPVQTRGRRRGTGRHPSAH